MDIIHLDIINENEIRELDLEIRQVSFQVRDTGSFLSWLRDLSNRNGVSIVCFNAELMAGHEHVISAMFHAKRAMKKGTCISSSFEIEALLYAAGSRQCQDAAKFGVHQGLNNCYLCIYPINPQVWSDLSPVMTISTDDWERMTDEKMTVLTSVFGITNDEIVVTGKDRIKDLVLERVALLEVNK
ncbi:MAG: KEOPS complex subunit Cgi121 [Methanomicrobiales archaeon]